MLCWLWCGVERGLAVCGDRGAFRNLFAAPGGRGFVHLGPHVSCLAGLVQASGKHGGLPRVRGCRDEGLRAVCWLMEEEASLTWGPLVSCFAGGCAADSVQALCADKH